MVVKLLSGDMCECGICYIGVDCGIECNGYGKCEQGVCVCYSGWRGVKCEIVGCLG